MYTEPESGTELKVSDLPRGVRPREKMMQGGARGLSHVELLAVILGTGTRRENVLKVAERLIRRYGVVSLPALTVREWMGNPGIGQARACRLSAVFELSRRAQKAGSREAPCIAGPQDVYAQSR